MSDALKTKTENKKRRMHCSSEKTAGLVVKNPRSQS